MGHSDRDEAKAHALKQAAKLEEGDKQLRTDRLTLALVFASYRQNRTQRKSVSEQQSDVRRMEQLAGLERQRGSRWHAYRRKWATERKHMPDVDLAAAGGWAPPAVLPTGRPEYYLAGRSWRR